MLKLVYREYEPLIYKTDIYRSKEKTSKKFRK